MTSCCTSSEIGGRPVPAQQSLGSYQKDRPSYPWEQPAQRREQRTVGGLQAGPWMLAVQHRELLA
jgi:hypothetical protein